MKCSNKSVAHAHPVKYLDDVWPFTTKM